MIVSKKILIIGGAGFVGSHLCEELVNNNTVCSLDNYSFGSKDNHVRNVEYFEGDCKDIAKILPNNNYDYVFHFGEYSRVEQSFIDISTVFKNNLEGMFPVLNYCKKNNSKLIYSSSSTILNSIQDNIEVEISPYSFTKSQNVKLIKNFNEWFRLNFSIVYFYNVYGKNEIDEGKYATVVGKFLKLKKMGAKTLPVSLPGSQRRYFTHIDDIISGILIVAEKGSGDGYGIGSDKNVSVIELANLIGIKIEFYDSPSGNRLGGMVENQKTKLLGWHPKKKLEDYIIEYIKNNV